MLKKSLQLPDFHLESSIVKWVDEISFVLYTCSKAGGHYLSYFQNNNDNWLLINRIETDPINVLSTVFEDKILDSCNLVLVGYSDGKIEHLQTPSLKAIDFSRALFPGMFAVDGIDSFFNEVALKKLYRPPSSVQLSPNGFTAEFLTGKGKTKIVEVLDLKCKQPLEEEKLNFVNTLSSFLFVAFIKNNNGIEDFRSFLSEFPSYYAKLISKKVCEIFISHVSLEHNLSSAFFAPELGNLEIDILSLVYFVQNALSPASWACRNSYLMLQLRFVKEMFLKACTNPLTALDLIGDGKLLI